MEKGEAGMGRRMKSKVTGERVKAVYDGVG